jgi:hypothetical protein
VAGFVRPTTTQTPDTLFDHWLPRLTGAELRVLLYAVRRTFGFRKDQDAISRGQFLQGIRSRDGRVLDEGTGIGSGTTLSNAIGGLIERGLLLREKRYTSATGDQVSLYRTNISEEPLARPEIGFQAVNTTQVPDDLFDYWLARLGDAELRVLLYIIRRTLGFRRQADDIALNHFIHGLVSRDGRTLDEGCGVTSEKAIYSAIRKLKEYGLIASEQRRSDERGHLWTRYSVLFAGELPRLLNPDERASMGERGVHDGPLPLPPPVTGPGSNLNRQGIQIDLAGYPVQTGPRLQFDPDGSPVIPGRGIQLYPVGYPVESGTSVRSSAIPPATNLEGSSGDVGSGDAPMAGGGVHLSQAGSPVDAAPVAGATGLHSMAILDPQQTVDQQATNQQTAISYEIEQQQQTSVVVVLTSDEEIAAYLLSPGDVFTETDDGNAQVVSLLTLVRQDIEATLRNYGLRITTDCYYSANQFLGIGGEEWTSEEERKREYHLTLRQETESLYNDIGAFSIDEGLAQYFTADLVARFHSDNPDEQHRQRGWLRYIRSEAGNNLQNPAGFLRTRLESGQWPPRAAARVRSRRA